ncbi:SPOR domain-containing protein [Serpentinicella alkaliphila]|nr:SPOR domain-containing protein [Serpentinicella alkaliphila]QUH26041.1 SPOR domain-containing protein [Serpentinicella alkaliphila]
MRRRKFRQRTQHSGLRKGIIFGIIFCILLPVGAIYIGLKITENWIVPVFDSSELLGDNTQEILLPGQEEKQEEKEVESNLTEVGEIKPLAVYAIQIASIADRSNIDKLIGELNNKGLPHLIYSVDNKFKIFTHGSTKRADVEGKIDEVKGHYPDAFISEMFLPKKVVKYDEKDSIVAEIIGDINNIIELIDKQSEEWYNYGGSSTYVELLNKHEELLDNLNIKITDDKFSGRYFNKSAFEKAVIYQKNNINSSKELLESKENNHRIHSLYLDSLFRVVEFTK